VTTVGKIKKQQALELELRSTITCPHCGHQATETMPTDACVGFYLCKGCGTTLRPKRGECCVFCSYGTVPCPPIQHERRRSRSQCSWAFSVVRGLSFSQATATLSLFRESGHNRRQLSR
jgi:hypothetical protein